MTQRRFLQMDDVIFSDFCAEVGIDNIRMYEQEHLKQQTELEKKRSETSAVSFFLRSLTPALV